VEFYTVLRKAQVKELSNLAFWSRIDQILNPRMQEMGEKRSSRTSAATLSATVDECSPPAAWHNVAQVLLKSCGASFWIAALAANSRTTCQTTFSVILSPQTRQLYSRDGIPGTHSQGCIRADSRENCQTWTRAQGERRHREGTGREHPIVAINSHSDVCSLVGVPSVPPE